MADNIQLNVGTGGDLSAAKDISGVKYPRVLLQYDAAGAHDVDGTHPLPVFMGGCATATDGSVAWSATAGTIVSSNTARKHLKIHNNADTDLHCRYAASATTTTASGFVIAAGETWEMEATPYTGLISGIWEGTGGTGSAVWTETSV
jgi:hypothetical protein